jgi:chaperone required for assembly of F1-ATPase
VTEVDTSKLAVREAPRPKPKRVYKTVSIAAEGEGWRVLLDGKAVSTPMRKPMATPKKALAEAIAEEWDAQKIHIDPDTMPLTRLLSTMIDKVGPERAAILAALMTYADTDLLCYRAAHPAELRRRQETVWQPVLDWLTATTGASLEVVEGIVPTQQPPKSLATLKRALETLDELHLTAFQACAAVSSSLALSLALVQRRLSAAEVFAASQLDESYQIEKWGEDDLATERRARISAELDGIGRFLALIKPMA